MVTMNTTAVQTQMPANFADLTAGIAQGDGSFAALLMALFGNGEGGITGEMGTLLQSGESEQTGKKENEAAMQMMAELFAMNLPFMELLQAGDAEAVLGNGMDLSALTGLLQQNGQTFLSSADLPAALNAAFSRMGLTPEAVEGQLQGMENKEGELPIISVSASDSSGSSGSSMAELLEGQAKFRQAVLDAQKALSTGQKDTVGTETAIDIDALQRQIDAQRTSGEVSGAQAQEATPADTAQQLKENILKNLSSGENEFTVKLKPESLGEITVNMVEKDGKISLSILTASAQTAKLLNESVEALKNALRPLQAEVREIVTRPEQPSETPQGGFFGSGFEGFQQQQFTGSERPYYAHEAAMAAAQDEDAAAEAQAAGIPEGLYAYI